MSGAVRYVANMFPPFVRMLCEALRLALCQYEPVL